MIRPFKRWNGYCYLQAGLAGVIVDCALFLAALAIGVASPTAAGVAYLTGALAHGLICNRGVFVSASPSFSQLRERQQWLFAFAVLLGLVITIATIVPLIAIGVQPLLAKVAAIFASFGASFFIRRRMLLVA